MYEAKTHFWSEDVTVLLSNFQLQLLLVSRFSLGGRE